ncbi:hypothetical protein GJAV_G00109450 [Gymnothorax javanicus]|nr:hypothetical protein GJAV_G00109450 [Gymnothorax javanicus]
MFCAGVIGNVIACVLLETRRRKECSRERHSLFRVLVTALVVTDLMGTCAVSPAVLASYANNKTMVALGDNEVVCKYFGFSMTFFSLATLSILFGMALERCFSIGFPFVYERHFRRRCGYISVALIYAICVIFCVLPFLGVGRYVQYCPGTWCFIDMKPEQPADLIYTSLHATVMVLLISSTVFCNVFVICHLVLMHRRRGGIRWSTESRDKRHHSFSMTEVDHLLFLVFITVAFAVCSLPLAINHAIGLRDKSLMNDLLALRFLSINSIIDPWVFIILGPSALRFLREALFRRCRTRPFTSQTEPPAPLELSHRRSPSQPEKPHNPE